MSIVAEDDPRNEYGTGILGRRGQGRHFEGEDGHPRLRM